MADFVGGVTDGLYGAASMHLVCPHDMTEARKGWFFFENQYVCLGAGIKASADYPVITTVNQCLLNGEIIAKAGNKRVSMSVGSNVLPNTSWVLHDNVAYIFPTPVTAHIDDSAATGNWRQITHQSWATEDPVEKNMFALWLDHGKKPTNGQYAYIVVPNAGDLADKYLKKPPVSILSNTPALQAVRQNEMNYIQAAFYEAGELKLNKNLKLSADRPCLVMAHVDGSKKIDQLVVSDPTQRQNYLLIGISGRFEGSDKNWRATWNEASQQTVIRIDMPEGGNAGKSVVINL
jgi:chondroitin AC lyase